MAKKQKPDKAKDSNLEPKPAPKSVELNVGGNIDGNVVVGDHNVINNYFTVVEKNTEKHEPDFWALKHPYPMPPNFTGRIAERAALTHWLKEDSENRLFILRALGGFGKSALTWQWLTHDVDIKEYPKVLWWSFYEGDASFEHFIEETLKYLKLEVPQGQRPQVDTLLKAMQGGKILLVMDGFERALRAYSSMNAAYQGDESPLPEGEGKGGGGSTQLDCVNINAEIFLKSVCSLPNIKSKVLMTTRLTPRAVKPRGEFMLGCREEELTAMQKADAVEFFHKQKIKGTHAEIEAACALYGYHPLSLRLLAGRILKDFENPADIVVAQKLKIDGDIKQQKHHVLEVSYNSLSPNEQKLLSTIACFRSPVEHKTLESIAENKGSLDTDLHDLVDRGLLHFDDKNKKFDLHPIVRRYAYERLTAPDRTAAHTRLSDYFAAIRVPEKPQTLEDIVPVIELYHHTVQAAELDEAFVLFRDLLARPLYFQMSASQTIIELLSALFDDVDNIPTYLVEESALAWILGTLGNAYCQSGQPHRAVSYFEKASEMSGLGGHKFDVAMGMGNIAIQQIYVGNLSTANSKLGLMIDLSKKNKDIWREAIGHQEIGHLLSYSGSWQEAEQEFEIAHILFDKREQIQSQSIVMAYRALRTLLMTRDSSRTKSFDSTTAIEFAQQALDLTNEETRRHYSHPRDYVRAHGLLGAAYRANGHLTKAEENLSKAISMCRQINLVEMEADILLDLARLRYDQKNYGEAKSLAEEALSITERCGYVLQGADVNLFLAQYALEQEQDKVKAKGYAETALKLATCDGPPYYYKVAYDEAERMLKRMKAEG